MYQLQSTETFDDWLRTLQDRKGRARILATQARDITKAHHILKDLGKE